MDNRDFMEKCRQLKEHFTKLTLADTAQSHQETDVAGDIINDAKKLLFYEQLDALSDQDIARLRQNSVLKYAKTLENYMPKGQRNKQYFPQPKRNFGSNLHTILETQTENKENDETWDETQVSLEEMKRVYEDRKMKQRAKNETITEQLFNANVYEEDGMEDLMEQYEEYFQTTKEIKGKYDSRQSKMEAMKMDCEKYCNIRTKIDEELQAMRKECVSMKEAMGNIKEKEKIKTKKDKIEKEVRFLEDPILEKKMENLEQKEKMTERQKEKINAMKNLPELQIIPQAKTNIVQLLDIKKLQIENSENQSFDTPLINNEPLLKSTLTKWRQFAKDKKSNRTKSKTNTKKIENFLENLQKFKLSNSQKSKSDLHDKEKQKTECISVKTKPKSSSLVETKVSSFEYRFKAQKDIIAMQKAKLAEQNKLIEELKLTRIQKEARESLEKAQHELEKTVQQSTRYKYRFKPPEPVIETLGDDPIGVAFSLNLSKAPKLVQLMEERAKEREEKRLLIKERKRMIEDEKKRLAEEAIERKTREESEEKQQRLQRMKKQRELARQLEMRRQWEKKRFITINQLAQEHYRQKLMKNYGMKHFRMLVYNVKIKMEIGKRFYENNIVMRCYYSWKKHAQGIVAEKIDKAVRLYEYKMKLKWMKIWKQILYEAVQCKQVAIDRYEMNLQCKVFIYWHRLVCQYHIQYRINAQKAGDHYKRVLLFQCLHNWRSLPDVMRIERVQNERKRKWRLRVAEILSDYDPLKCYD